MKIIVEVVSDERAGVVTLLREVATRLKADLLESGKEVNYCLGDYRVIIEEEQFASEEAMREAGPSPKVMAEAHAKDEARRLNQGTALVCNTCNQPREYIGKRRWRCNTAKCTGIVNWFANGPEDTGIFRKLISDLNAALSKATPALRGDDQAGWLLATEVRRSITQAQERANQ